MRRVILVIAILLLKSNLYAQVIDTVQFNNGKANLTGVLVRPSSSVPDKKVPVVVVLHYASGGVHSDPLYQTLASDLNDVGVAAFLYDRRGEGLSSTAKNTGDYFDLAADARSAIQKLKTFSYVDSTKIGLYGVSQGCWISAITNTLVPNIRFQVLVSPSTIAPSPQMDYAASANLVEKGFNKSAIDSAIRLRNIIDDFYRGKVSRQYADEQRKKAENARWFSEAYVFDLDESPETGTWRRDMDFNPLIYFKKAISPTLVFYGEYDKWVPIDRGVSDWNSLGLKNLTIKRVANVGHLMIIDEKDEPKSPVFSLNYRNAFKEWVKSKMQ